MIAGDLSKMPAFLSKYSEQLEGRTLLAKRLKVLPVEAIVRGYITGSAWKDYLKAGSICGVAMPRDLEECAKLPQPIYTPSTKAEVGDHDESISIEEADKIIGNVHNAQVQQMVLEYYKKASELVSLKGLLIADCKFELGLDRNGEVVLADEILTPDCSRFWSAKDYKPGQAQRSYDKQYFRDWLLSINFDKTTPLAIPEKVAMQTFERYVEVFQIITGSQPRL